MLISYSYLFNIRITERELMTVSVGKIAVAVSAAIWAVAGALCSTAMADDAVLQITTSPLGTDLARSINNASGLAPVIIREMNSIPALEQMCKNDEDAVPSLVISVSSIPRSIADKCVNNGIDELSEASLGFITLVLVQKSSDPAISLSDKQIFRALAAQVPDDETPHANTAKTWADIDSSLPPLDIKVIMAPRPGRSRALFEDEVLVGGCRQFSAIQNIFDAKSRVATCVKLRDGAVQEVDDVKERIQALRDAAPGAVGLFSISVANQNKDWMRVIPFNGFMPTPEAINGEDYNLTVPIYVYARPDNLAVSGPVQTWMKEALSDAAIGESGYGKEFGLVELSASTREWQRHQLFQ